MDRQIGSLLNKFREAVQNNEVNRRYHGDDGNELRVVEASRVFISRINPNLTSQHVLDYFEVLSICKMTNSIIEKLKRDNFVSKLNSKLKEFIKSRGHNLDFEISQILCQTIVLLIRKSLSVSSYLHQNLQAEGVWHTFAMLIHTCPVQNMLSLLNYVKEAAIFLQEEYLDNMEYDSQTQCLGTYLLLMDMTAEESNSQSIGGNDNVVIAMRGG